MLICIDDKTKEVHLLGLGLGTVELIRSALVDKIFKTRNDEVTARAIALIELTDSGVENMLTANLEPKDVDNL